MGLFEAAAVGVGYVRRGLVIGLPWLFPALVVLTLAAAGEEARGLLRYERDAVLDGELWRVVSGHWVHLSPTHALLNLLGLALMQLALGSLMRPWRSLGVLLACQLGVGLGLMVFSPEAGWYVGLSGALHGYIVALVFMSPPVALLPAVGVPLAVAGKVAWELLSGPSPALESLVGGPVLTVAHLYGAGTGAVLAVLLWLSGRDGRRSGA
jgi:rhomboid family GlyGly-CTERM serine protease